MNERMIIELATKANLGPACESQAIAIKKFAELIVQECIDVVDVGGEFVSRPKMVERLKEHFGVEE